MAKNKVFTRKELIAAVAKETGLPQTKVAEVLLTTVKIEIAKLKLGFAVRVLNGCLKIVAVKARKGVNPRTGRKITIPASKKPKFVFSSDFKKNFKK